MTNLNHAATGALVAVAIHNPWVGLPAAFFSHFVIDAIPHWNWYGRHSLIRQVSLAADLVLTLGLLLLLSKTVDAPAWLVIAGGLLGISPDFMWAPYFLTGKTSKTHKKTPLHLARRFHFWIQTKEFAEGILVEAGWLVLTLVLIYQVHKP